MDVLLAVNGTLMRGLELNGNLLAVGARFMREARTAPTYRLWSIEDRHPAMIRVAAGGAAIAVEVWSVPAAGLATILQQEPPGLCIGKVRLSDGQQRSRAPALRKYHSAPEPSAREAPEKAREAPGGPAPPSLPRGAGLFLFFLVLPDAPDFDDPQLATDLGFRKSSDQCFEKDAEVF